MLQQAARREAALKLLALAREATLAVEAILRDATAAVRARVRVETHTVERLFDREQRATHGLAWLATYVEGIRQVTAFAERAHHAGTLGEAKELMVAIGIGEFLAQIEGGIPMSQGEIVRPADLGLSAGTVAMHLAGPLAGLMTGNEARRARLVELLRDFNDFTVGGPDAEGYRNARPSSQSAGRCVTSPGPGAF
jgi:(2S)-methylsuccinyl-CoA dehydrogenase